jgi:ATP-dependent helicase HrpA
MSRSRGRSPASPPLVEQRLDVVRQLRARGGLDIPQSLPIADRRDDLLTAIGDNQVVIVAGETGSGKSTQLPKLCLELGRGVHGLIGHTQPRRVAARTIAERLAEEMGVEMGGAVGYTVRFTDHVGEDTLVKVMTDGILLAEIQRDRMLRRYDTIIVDEAHERSLNVDFLLGYLHGLLRRRPDLHLIVTSATIDTERFAAHFAGPDGPAPIVAVSGRTYPVEVRYRPIGDEPDDDRDQVQAVCDAVDELAGDGRGDVLVFLSGEREIRDVADALRRQTAERAASLEVLPLYARLSAAEQHRIFQPHSGRRVVLATNVAETSITVPGVRYVVDAGSARVSRYSHRLKVQRLPIEAVSQASANQRAGRCGRVAPGVCIRLYAEDDFQARPEFTEPEILRTNLASVILQMTALGLGDVASFPFLDPPDSRSVRDGYALLDELGAMQPQADGDPVRRLTELGRRLARLPVDPRLGRMVLEAERLNCVREVLVITAALSIQDPRERPAEAQQAADEAHRRFATDGSDFLALVRLWDHLRERQQELGSSQFRKLCRVEYLNYLRVREWQDLYSQLRQIVGTLGIHLAPHNQAGTPELGHPDRIHQALLSGLLSQLGMRDGTTRDYRGAHGSTFAIARGSSVAKALPRWIMAAELVETNRLWARTVTSIQPEWAERIGEHLVRRTYAEPRWDARRGGAVTTERVLLYGLPIVAGRTVGLDKIDAPLARWMFIRHALVEGDWTTHHHFAAHNIEVVEQLRALEERTRSSGMVDDDSVHGFYEARIGPDVVSTRHFDRWWKGARRHDPDLLTMSREALLGSKAGDKIDDFPELWHQDDMVFELSYRFEPGTPDDGVTVHIPLPVLNRVSTAGFDWQVPGLRDDLIGALIRTLPKDYRREMVPLNDMIAGTIARLPDADGQSPAPLADALAATLTQVSRVIVPPELFDPDRVPLHLRVTFDILDAEGRSLGRGKDLDALRRRLNPQLRAAIAAASPLPERSSIVTWDLGTLPQSIDNLHDGHMVRGYPTLVDDGDSVSLRILTNAALQQRVMRSGVRRLLLLAVPVGRRAVEGGLKNEQRLAVAGGSAGSLDQLIADCTTAAADRVVRRAPALPWDAEAFADLVRVARNDMPSMAAGALQAAASAIGAATAIERRLDALVAPALTDSVADARQQVRRLVRPGFVTATGVDRLDDVVRYLRGVARRLDKLPDDPVRDQRRTQLVTALERRYIALLDRLGSSGVTPDIIELGWTLEELRISEFAQVVGTKRPVSPQRVSTELARLNA